ncbi:MULTISPECIES: PAAR domain-containing protein [Rhodomicrobium]|uniref:PAAR domain-containing protein n=1 Tax=Rhodomicrobium TaxID=1068 RepID=UPI001FDA9233|nr:MULTISPECIES: PAAR domain-containing protein [Rhodomicrobium]
MRHQILAVIVAASFAMGTEALAQQAEPESAAPGVVVEGSPDVSIGDLPAARKDDATDQATTVTEGSADVFINGKPAATVGDLTACGGSTVTGASNVYINGEPAARAGDLTTACPQ